MITGQFTELPFFISGKQKKTEPQFRNQYITLGEESPICRCISLDGISHRFVVIYHSMISHRFVCKYHSAAVLPICFCISLDCRAAVNLCVYIQSNASLHPALFSLRLYEYSTVKIALQYLFSTFFIF
jgi:hypothetical protein